MRGERPTCWRGNCWTGLDLGWTGKVLVWDVFGCGGEDCRCGGEDVDCGGKDNTYKKKRIRGGEEAKVGL